MYQKGFIRLLAISDFFTTLCKDFFIVTIAEQFSKLITLIGKFVYELLIHAD